MRALNLPRNDTQLEWYIALCIGAVVIFLIAADKAHHESSLGDYRRRPIRKAAFYAGLFGMLQTYRVLFIDGPYTLRPFLPHVDASGIPSNSWLELAMILVAVDITAVVMPTILLSWLLAPAFAAFALGRLSGRRLWLHRSQRIAKSSDNGADVLNRGGASPKRPFGRKK